MVGRPVYLVMEPQALVAEDLAGAITEVDPQAIVLRAGSADEAVRALAPHGTIAVAILHCGPDGIAATPLGQALAARGAALVFTGDAAEAAASEGVGILLRPFSDEAVAVLLAGMQAERAGP